MWHLLNAGQIMYGIQLPDRYNIELLRIEHERLRSQFRRFELHAQPGPA